MIPKTIQQKIDEGRQYRSIDLNEMRTDGEEGSYIVEGYATTFNQPYELFRTADYSVVEQIDRNAFENTDMSDVLMQFNHEGKVYARISNGTLELNTDDHGLNVRADLGGTEIGRQLFEEIKGGYITKMSFGFTVDQDKREESRNTETGMITILRTITAIRKLYDVSAVSLPAND